MHEELKAGKIDLNEFYLLSPVCRARLEHVTPWVLLLQCMAEALGTSLPHNAAIPAVDSRRYVLAHLSGMRIVDMVHEDLRL